MLLLVVLLGIFAAATALDCTGQPDGIYEYTCFSYTRCIQGVAVEIRCNSTDIFDPNQQRCVTPTGGYWPCTNVVNCQNLADNRYPDYNEGCQSYYTCHNGLFLGNSFCPDGLVFDFEKQLCNWPYNVPPPCGTA
ncbi:uncharacterized protein LOC124138751 [Haliotis rufescens]|uniref:uncharacterized protein LOC124138751 n=1 Tax=Haliotis rufescens TaxID=6454 RepID=UPI001EB0160E|nr:uncharacterized protein LOC124138751 [Haliotis rufescens]